MKIVCSKENLAEGINMVQKAVSSRTTLPILEGILLEAGDEFKMTGNDLEMGINCCVQADIIEKGSIVVNSRIFGEIIRRLPDDEVSIEVNEQNNVVIECGNSYFEIKGISPEGFPAIPEIERENGLKISQKLLRDMIRQTIFAVSIDENRQILTGSLVECKNGELSFVSIDGFRMALRRSGVEEEIEEFKAVIPGKTLNEVAKILQPEDNEVFIYATKNQVLFDLGRCTVVSRLLEGEYLNYREIIPKEHETKVRVHVKELLSCIERAALVITAEERRYPVKFDIADDKIIISSSTEIGTVREEIKAEMTGNSLEIYFNHRYFIEALRAIEDEFADVYFTNSVGPCTIMPLEGDYFAYLILPVRR